jgi:hypothetical protein
MELRQRHAVEAEHADADVCLMSVATHYRADDAFGVR